MEDQAEGLPATGLAGGGPALELKENGSVEQSRPGESRLLEEEDENDTMEESHRSKTSALQDDSMRTPIGNDGSSRHDRRDSDADSFLSCLNLLDSDSSSDRDSKDDNDSDDDSGGSEYSESMRFSSRHAVQGYTARLSPTQKKEGAPTFAIPGPGQEWPDSNIGNTKGAGVSNSSAVEGLDAPKATHTRRLDDPPHPTTPPQPRRKPRRLSGRKLQGLNAGDFSAAPGRGVPKSLSARSLNDSSAQNNTPPRRRERRLSGKLLQGLTSGAAGSPKKIFEKAAGFARSRTTGGIPRRPSMARAATERFRVESVGQEEDGKPKFKRFRRSRSMDLQPASPDNEDGEEERPWHRPSGQHNRISVAFGASREQAHYQPKVIRKSRKTDIQTGGDAHREVVCQRIIDYPEAMDPTERRRKMVMRTGTDAQHRGQSMHGAYIEPQYRLQSRCQHSNAVRTTLPEEAIRDACLPDLTMCFCLIESTKLQFKDHIHTKSVQPGALTTYLIWSLRSNFILVLLSEACAFWILISLFALCIYAGATQEPDCLRFPDGNNFEENGSHFLDAFSVSWTTFSTVVRSNETT